MVSAVTSRRRQMTSRAMPLVLATIAAATAPVAGQGPLVPGANVNMVRGTAFIGGDPFLQRQNEPSLAISTRNPCHLLAGANDYRTVDFPDRTPIPNEGAAPSVPVQNPRDAWLGVFTSMDCGTTWRSSLLPGHPFDVSPAGLASPNRGFTSAADPVVRAGTNGLFFYAGLVFDRADNSRSQIFVARLIDNNNKERGETIEYVDASPVDTGDPDVFVDKPWVAVDQPRAGAQMCDINGQRFPAGRVYVAWARFEGGGARIMLSRSLDCGRTWQSQALSDTAVTNQGANIAVAPHDGTVHVVWRQFAREGSPATIQIATSRDAGATFTRATVASPISPFDQAKLENRRFRTNSLPTVAADHLGRVYVAWAERGFARASGRTNLETGDSRIVLAVSADGGHTFAPRYPIDDTALDADGQPRLGHQVMPSLTFTAGKIQAVYYDFSDDLANTFNPFVDEAETPPVDPSNPGIRRRHTVDVRAAHAQPAAQPVFIPVVVTPDGTSPRLSQYRTIVDDDGTVRQVQFNPPNLPLFVGGTTPFIGDYIDVAGLSFVPFQGAWRHNNSSTTGPRFDGVFPSLPAFHAVWTDHRDVKPPLDGDWTLYKAPGDPFWRMPDSECVPDRAGMRNANIYTARMTAGLYAGSPGNTKPLGFRRSAQGSPIVDPTTGRSVHMQRSFVVFVQNALAVPKKYLLRIVNQPGAAQGDRASFSRAPQPPFSDADLATRPYIWLVANVAPLSTISRTVFVTSANERAMVRVDVLEVAPGVAASIGNDPRLAPLPIANGPRATVLLNPDPTNPPILDPDFVGDEVPQLAQQETHDPEIFDPVVTTIPAVRNAAMELRNPDEANPDEANPDEANIDEEMPDEANPDEANPDEANPDEANPDEANPDEANAALRNTALADEQLTSAHVVDVQWKVKNRGNTTTAFRFSPTFSGSRTDRHFQLLVTKRYYVPAVDGNTCELGVRRSNQVLVNVSAFNPRNPDEANPDEANPDEANPDEANPDEANPDEANPDEANATFFLAPGETATATLRIYDLSTPVAPPPQQLAAFEGTAAAVVESFAVNTGQAAPPRDAAGADLVAANAVASPANAGPGATVQVSWTLANRGTEATPSGVFRTRFLLSSDRDISEGDTELAVITTNESIPPDDPSTPAVNEGERPQTTVVTLPGSPVTGPRYILVLTDSLNDVPEADEVNNAAAAQLLGTYGLVFTAQPLAITQGFGFSTPIRVAVIDAAGQPSTAVSQVTLTIASGPAGGTLSGVATAPNVDGVATFAPLTLPLAGTYTLRATGVAVEAVVAPAVSAPFNVEPDDAPVAVMDSYAVPANSVLVVSSESPNRLTVNDVDELRAGPGIAPPPRVLTAALVGSPAHGIATVNAGGGFEYTPAEGFNGIDFFTYQLHDGVQSGNVAIVRIVVGTGEGNAPPVTQPLAVTVAEDSVNTPIDVLAAALDADGDALSILSASVINGSVVASGGRLLYTPGPDYSGGDTIDYVITDGRGGNATGAVAVTVTAVNDAPVANPDGPFTVPVNAPATAFAVLGNDNDGPDSGETLTIVRVGGASRGTASFTASEVRYVPNRDESGADSFSYEISDGNGGTASALVRVSVGDANHTPHAVDDSATVAEDGAINIPVLANDTDHESDDLTVASFTQGDHGDVELGPGATLRYQPAPNYHGSDTFTYRITDGTSFDIGTVRVNVTSVNDSPEARPDHTTTVRNTAVEIDVVSNDIDVEKCPACTPLQYGGELIFFSSARGATAAGQSHIWAVRPDGTDLTQVTFGAVVDRVPQLRSDGRTLAFQRTVAGSQQIWTLDLVTRATARLIGPDDVQGNASFPSWSPDGSRLAFSVTVGAAAHVWVTPYPTTTDGIVRVTPTTGVRTWPSWAADNVLLVGRQVGEDTTAFAIHRVDLATGAETELIPFAGGEALPKVSFDGSRFLWASLRNAPAGDIYLALLGGTSPIPAAEQRRVTPASGYSEAAWSPEGHRIVASNAAGDLVVFNEDGSGELVIVGDPAVDSAPWWGRVAPAPPPGAEPGRLTVISVTDPGHGLAEVLADGRVRYTPDAGYTGSDTFEYIVSDGNTVNSTDTGQVLIAVIGTGAANASPTANDDATTAPEDTQLTLDVVANDVDPDGDPLFIVALPSVGVGGVMVHPGDPRSVIYTPPPNFNGVDFFTYTVSDGRGGTDTAQVVVNLTPVNDDPDATDDFFEVSAGVPSLLAVLANDTSAPDTGEDLTITSVTDPAHGTAEIAGAQIRYTPDPGFSGPDSLTYRIGDGNGGTDEALVTIEVLASADLAVSIVRTPTEPVVGTNLTYSVSVTNLGPTAADGVVLTNTLPANVTFVSAGSPCERVDTTVTCALGEIVSGGSVMRDIVVTPTDDVTITYVAQVVSAAPDPDSSNNQAQDVALVRSFGTCSSPSFVGARMVNSGVEDAWALATGDFNEDGLDDVVVSDVAASAGNSLALLLGGSLTPTFFPAGANAQLVLARDFNNDENLDVAVVNRTGSTVSVLLGNGSGSLGPPTSFPTSVAPFGLEAADLDGDGDLDLVVGASGTGSDIAVMLGIGTGVFGAPSLFDSGPSPLNIIIEDFDGDGIADVAVPNADTPTVSVLRGLGNGTFAPRTTVTLPGTVLRLRRLGDVTGDGRPDLGPTVSVDGGPAGLMLLPNDGAGGFGAAREIIPASYGVGYTIPAHLNGDGHLDLAAISFQTNSLLVLFGQGGGEFGNPVPYLVGTSQNSFDFGDLDGDGRLDIVGTRPGSGGMIYVLTSRCGAGETADLSVTMSGPDTATAGDTLDYTTVVLNHGPAAATNVTMTHVVPQGMEFVAITAGADCEHAAGTVTCTTGTLMPDVFTGMGVRVRAFAAGTRISRAGATSSQSDPSLANNLATVAATIAPSPVTFGVTNTNDAGPGSLRQAILDSNLNTGSTNTIAFNIPGDGPFTIALRSALPTTTVPVVIDGTTQPGFQGTPVIRLDGTLSQASRGLQLGAGNSTVRGLAIGGFQVEGASAIFIPGGPSGASGANTIVGNYLGVDIDGTTARPNARGVIINNSSGNTIGNIQAGAGNLIAFNGIGVIATSGERNQILGNAIFSNSGLGIDLGADGVTANDPGDGDGGANTLQNYPVLTAVFGAAPASAQGTLNSTPNATFTLDFYASASCDQSGFGEGATFIGSHVVTTDAAGNAAFTAALNQPLPAGNFVTATAIDSAGNSSEFSACIAVSSNRNPTANDDEFTTSEDIAGISYGVLANDTDPDSGDVLRVTAVTQGAHGAVDFDPETANTVRYVPQSNFNGADEFTYTVGDGNGGFDTATVRVTVTPVNDAPTVLMPIADRSAHENAPPTQVSLAGVFADVDDAVLTYSIASNSNPDLVTPSITGTTLTLTYARGGFGVADIAVRARDAAEASVVDAFVVTVNRAPTPTNVNGPGTTVVSYFNPEPLPPEAIPPVAAFAKASVFNPAPLDEDVEPPSPFGSATTVSVFNPAPVDTADEPPKVIGAAMVVSFLNPAEDEDPAQEPTPFGAAMVVSFFNPAPVEGPEATPTPFGGFSLVSFAVGPSVHDVTPGAMSLSATMPQILTLSGENLESVTAVTLSETTGITVSAPLVAPDGRSLTVSIVLAANAPHGAVRVSVSSPLGSSVVTERTYFMIVP